MEKETEEKIEEKDSVEAGYTVGDYFDISPSRRKEIMEDISKLFAETQNVETVEMAIKETFDNGDYDANDLFYSSFAMAYIVSSSRLAEDSSIRARAWDFLLGIRRGDENGFVDPFARSFPVAFSQLISSNVLSSAIKKDLQTKDDVSVSDEDIDAIEREIADRKLEKPQGQEKQSSEQPVVVTPVDDSKDSEESIKDFLKSKENSAASGPGSEAVVGSPGSAKEPTGSKKRLGFGKKDKGK